MTKINGMTPGRYHHHYRKLREQREHDLHYRQVDLCRMIGYFVPVDTGEYREWRR